MNVDKIRDYDNAELATKIHEAGEQRFRLKFQLGMGQTEGINKYRVLRKDQARMLTVQRQRELNPELAPEPVKGKKKGK